MRTRSNPSRPHKNGHGLSLAKQRQPHEHIPVDNHNVDKIQTSTSVDKAQDGKRIETRLKTPKSERKKESNTEFMCSQHFDSQIDVGWDCNSPDTIRGLRKLSGDHETHIPDIFMKLIAAEPDPTEPRRGTPPLLGIWDKTDAELSHSKETRNLRARKRGRRKSTKDSAGSRDLLLQLSTALNQCAEIAETDEGSAESSIRYDFPENEAENSGPSLDNSADLFDSTKTEKESSGKLKLRVSPRLLERNKTAGTCVFSDKKVEESSSPACESAATERRISGVSDLLWSDDENFDDSFIIKATQFDDDKVKFSPIFGLKRKTSGDSILPKSKCSRFTFQLGNEDKSRVKGGIKNVPAVSSDFTSLSSKVSKNNDLSCAKTVGVVKKAPSELRPHTTDHNHNNTFVKKTEANAIKPTESVHCTNKAGSDKDYLKTNSAVSCSSVMVSCVGNNFPTTKPNFASNIAVTSCVNSVSRSTCTVVSNVTTSASTVRNFSFRKHNSFSGQGSANTSTCQPVRQRYLSGNVMSQSTISSSLKSSSQTVIGKSAFSRTCSTGFQPYTDSVSQQTAPTSTKPAGMTSRNTTSLSSTAKMCSTTATHCAPKSNSVVSKASTVSGNVRNVNLAPISEAVTINKRLSEGVFDTSLSDDLLFQLAEPDDALDSQVCNVTWTATDAKSSTMVTKPSTMVTKSSTIVSKSSNLDTNYLIMVTNSTRDKSRKNEQHNTFQKQTCSLASEGKKNNIPASKPCATNIATVQGCVPVTVPRQCSTKPSLVVKPSVLPVKPGASEQKSEETASAGFDVYSEDMFASDDDLLADNSLDDMLGDDGLTEPQILAMLDEAEMLATQQKSGSKKLGCGSNHGGSPGNEQTNQGKQPSSQRKPSSQGHQLSSQGKPSSQGQQFDCQGKQPGSRGQQSSSQGKPNSQGYQLSSQGKQSCSPAKQSNSQGQQSSSQGKLPSSQGKLPSSQGKQASSQDGGQGHPSSQGHSQTQTASQTKYSPSEIERKKREALERRRIRATQQPLQDKG